MTATSRLRGKLGSRRVITPCRSWTVQRISLAFDFNQVHNTRGKERGRARENLSDRCTGEIRAKRSDYTHARTYVRDRCTWKPCICTSSYHSRKQRPENTIRAAIQRGPLLDLQGPLSVSCLAPPNNRAAFVVCSRTQSVRSIRLTD